MHGWLGSWILRLALLVALLGLSSVGRAAPSVPPPPRSHVTDEAGVLGADVRDSLDRRLSRYERESGHQLVVWIGRTTDDVPIEEFAVEAFEQWKIGRPELDDGLGLFVMVEDRTLRVEVGYGLEPVLTDLLAARVIRAVMIPRILQDDWNGAIVAGAEALVDTIEGAPGSLPADTGIGESAELHPPPREWSPWKIAITAIGIVAFMILMATHPRLALGLLFMIGHGMGRREDGGGFSGLGGSSGGGGATGRW